MLDNHIYNLANQLVQENKSLWRIKNEYIKDAGECQDCLDFWKKLENEKERHIADLREIIKKHL